MNIEERILNIAEGPNWYDSSELRAIALDVRKMEDRIKRLEEAGDTMANAYREICYDAYDDQQVDNWLKAKETKP